MWVLFLIENVRNNSECGWKSWEKDLLHATGIWYVAFWSVGLIFIHWYTQNTVDSKHVHFSKKRPYTNGKMLLFLGSIPLSLSPVVIQRLRLMSWSHLISPSLIISWALDHGTPMGSEGKGGPEGFIDLSMVSHRMTHDVCVAVGA